MVGLLEPIWVQQDQPPAQEWPLRCPAGTAEFQLCLFAKHLTPEHLRYVRSKCGRESGHLKSVRPDSRVLHPFTRETSS